MIPENNERIPIIRYSAAELCQLYKVSKKTWLKWITPFRDDVGERQGRYYTINQVKIIFDKLGVPGEYTGTAL